MAAFALTPFPSAAQEPAPSGQAVSGVGGQTAGETLPSAAGHLVYLRATADQDYAFGHIGGGVTVHDQGPGSFSLWADAYTAIANDEADEDFEAGSLGAAYRRQLSQDGSWGAHAFIDLGTDDSFADTLAQVSVGGDYEKALAGAADPTLRLGGNFYVPLDDYTNIENYGVLDAAPQFGADAFAKYGRDLDTSLRLDLTAGAFDYAGGDNGDNLWGGFGSAGLTYGPSAAPGFSASAEVGLRYANGGDGLFNEEERVTPFLGVQLSYSWGGRRSTTRRVVTESAAYDPPRDCVVARDGDGQAYYDCTRPVIAGAGDAQSKEGVVHEILPLPPPAVEERTLVAAGRRPVAPMRNLGFNTAFAPVRRTFAEVPPPPPPAAPPPPPPPASPPPSPPPPPPPPAPPPGPPPSSPPPPPESPPPSPPPPPPGPPPSSPPPPPESPPPSPPPPPPGPPPSSPPPPPESPPPSPPPPPPGPPPSPPPPPPPPPGPPPSPPPPPGPPPSPPPPPPGPPPSPPPPPPGPPPSPPPPPPGPPPSPPPPPPGPPPSPPPPPPHDPDCDEPGHGHSPPPPPPPPPPHDPDCDKPGHGHPYPGHGGHDDDDDDHDWGHDDDDHDWDWDDEDEDDHDWGWGGGHDSDDDEDDHHWGSGDDDEDDHDWGSGWGDHDDEDEDEDDDHHGSWSGGGGSGGWGSWGEGD